MDAYQVRTWEGWHHHMALTLIAVWFLISETHRGTAVDAGLDSPISPLWAERTAARDVLDAWGVLQQGLDNLRRKDSLRGAETAEISVRLGNYSASHFEGSARSVTANVHGCPRGVAPLRPPLAIRDNPVAHPGGETPQSPHHATGCAARRSSLFSPPGYGFSTLAARWKLLI
jgi:hypothetical protein